MLHIKKIKPLFTSIVTTGDKYEEDVKDNSFIVANKGDLKTYQRVLAVGSSVRDVQVGDWVMIDMLHFAKMKYDPNSVKNDLDLNKIVSWDIPWVTMDDENGKPQDCLLISDRDVKYVFEGEEWPNEPQPAIVVPQKKLIIN